MYGGIDIVLAGGIRWGLFAGGGLGFRGFRADRAIVGIAVLVTLVLRCDCWLDFTWILFYCGLVWRSFLWDYFVSCLAWVSRFWDLVLGFWLFSLFGVGVLGSGVGFDWFGLCDMVSD